MELMYEEYLRRDGRKGRATEMVQGIQVLAAKLDAQNPYGGRRTDLMRYVHPYAHTGPPTVNNSFHKCQIKQN